MNRTQPVVWNRSQHCISRRDIDPDALKVLYRLARRGQIAYLVGGGVRDLLLGRRPKDFDVGTNANPRAIRAMFRNCFLIGRRFRLAHIKYGDKIIETSTFRRQPEAAENNEPAENGEPNLLQTSDNTFGTPEEDARRRDFTINGLFYDIDTYNVIDYVGGLADLQNRLVRAIGDPDIRFREDPIRMMRAVRFAARLGFSIEPDTYAALERHHAEIDKAAAPRLLEEVFRLFGFNSGEPAFRLLRKTGLLARIFPNLDEFITGSGGDESPFWNYLRALDRGDTTLPEPTQALILATIFMPLLDAQAAEGGEGHGLLSALQAALKPAHERMSIPRRILDSLSRIVIAQKRFVGGARRRFSKQRFTTQDYFLEALALYEIRLVASGQELTEATRWREAYQEQLDRRDGLPDPREARQGNEPSDRRDSSRREAHRDPFEMPEIPDDEPDEGGEADPEPRPAPEVQTATGGPADAESDDQGENLPASGPHNDEGSPSERKKRRRRSRGRRKRSGGGQGATPADNNNSGRPAEPAAAQKAAPAPVKPAPAPQRPEKPERPAQANANASNGGPLTGLDFYLQNGHNPRPAPASPPAPTKPAQPAAPPSRPAAPKKPEDFSTPHWLDEI